MTMGLRTCPRGLMPVLALAALQPEGVAAQIIPVPFTSSRWTVAQGGPSEREDRPCFQGIAWLDDVDFADGVIEVDVWVDGGRSYPGIAFRRQDPATMERYYVRPHKSGLYPDAQQYTPVINGVSGWQLYSGPGYTAATPAPLEGWLKIRLEADGPRARVFLNDGAQPSLEISHLRHGESAGGLGVWGPSDGSACFADFRYDPSARPDIDVTPEPEAFVPATITDWEISRGFKLEQVDRSGYPRFYLIFAAGWEPVQADASGLVDVSLYRPRTEGGPDLVLARTILESPVRQDVTLSFGYSDLVDVFLNGRKLFAGNSAYTSRDPTFAGIIGYHDQLTLTLERGLNELFVMVSESFGGWGFMGRWNADVALTAPVVEHGSTERVWAIEGFLTPETVVYDDARGELYVSSFDNNYQASDERTGYISRISPEGELLERTWVTDLDAPTGMGIRGSVLYVLERSTLTAIDIPSGTVAARYEIPDADFPNDLTVAEDGAVYITDTRPSSWIDSRIYRFDGEQVDVWLATDEISRANGILAHDGELLVGNSGDGLLKAVDLTHKTVRDIVSLGAGVIDGIQVTPMATTWSHTGEARSTASLPAAGSWRSWTERRSRRTRPTSRTSQSRVWWSFRRSLPTAWSPTGSGRDPGPYRRSSAGCAKPGALAWLRAGYDPVVRASGIRPGEALRVD